MLGEKSIATVVRNARKAQGLTQQDVAIKADVSRAYYADVERGRYSPSVKLMSSLGNILDIDLNFLKSNDGNTSENLTHTV